MSSFLYNPDRKDKQQLIAEFVVRTRVLDEIMHDVETADMQTPEQHYLLVGQRGSGKTTLLHRIKYAIEDNEALNKWLMPVIFTEEQYNISELANLWENICQTLEDYYGFESLYEEIEQYAGKANFEEFAFEILEQELNRHGKKLVLLIDNVGDLLQKLTDKEIRRLRELLQTKPLIRVIAASPFYLDDVLDYKQPFFEFFKVQRLDGLGREETEQLLLKLGEVYKEKEKIERILKDTPERVETLRVLTGGVPRTIALMFRIFVDHEHEGSLKDMERILDAVTPLYKHRMDDLPKQQQKIVDAVARNWDAITVKELKERVRLDSKTISAQLNLLEKNQVIEKRTSKTKNHLYLIKERFWNIWYLMRYGRKFDKERVVWLIRFMECWFSGRELEQRVIDFIKKIKNDELPQSSIELFGLAYASLETLALEVRIQLKNSLPIKMANAVKIEENKILEVAFNKIEGQKYNDALDLIRKITNLSDISKRKFAYQCFFLPPTVIPMYYNSLKDENLTPTDYSIIVIFLIIFCFMIVYGVGEMELNDEDTFKELRKRVETIKAILTEQREAFGVEFFLLDSMLRALILTDKANIAYRLFTDTGADYFKSKLEITYILVEYYRQNQDEAVLFRLPIEKKQIILQEIDSINKGRDAFNGS